MRFRLLVFALMFISGWPSITMAGETEDHNGEATAPLRSVLVTFNGQYQYLSRLYYPGPERIRQPRSVVVLKFMSLDCLPCRKILPTFLRVARAAAEQADESGDRFRFFLVSIDRLSARDKLLEYLKAHGIDPDTEVLLDPYQKTAEQFEVRGIPRTFVVSAQAQITADITGAGEDYQQVLVRGIETALQAGGAR